jgi:hypothetical protein
MLALRFAPQNLNGLQEILQAKEKEMMDAVTIGMYLVSLGMASFMGCMMVEVIDYKTDVILGIRQKRVRKKR